METKAARKHGYSRKKRLWAMYIIGALFIILLGLFLAGALLDMLSSGASTLNIVLVLIPFICVVLLLLLFIKRRAEAVKSGLILKDELIVRAEGNAGRYTAMLTIWFMLALLWYQGLGAEALGLPGLAARHVIYLTLFLMMALFFGLRWYFTRRGNV